MKKSILYRFIVLVILFFLVITSLGCYVLEYIYDRHPGVGLFLSFIIGGAGAAMVEEEMQDRDEVGRRDWWDIYTDLLITFSADFYKPSEVKKIKVIGTNKDFKPIEAQPISSTVTFSTMQGLETGSISISEEDMEKVVEGIEGESASITLNGNIESPYNLSPLTLVVNLGTGKVTGSFTGIYEYEGFDGMFYTDQPDTAKAKAEIKGKVDPVTGKIIGTGELVYTWVNAGGEENWPFTMEGVLSSDYKNANGDFVFAEGVWSWVASSQ